MTLAIAAILSATEGDEFLRWALIWARYHRRFSVHELMAGKGSRGDLPLASEASRRIRAQARMRTPVEVGQALRALTETGCLAHGDEWYQVTEVGARVSLFLSEMELQSSETQVWGLLRRHCGEPARRPRVLDFGGGTGVTLANITQRFPASLAVCLDPDIIALRVGWSAISDDDGVTMARWLAGSGYEVPCMDASFDIILVRQVLYLLDARRALKEMRRVLDADGIVIIFSGALTYFLGESIRRLPSLRGLALSAYALVNGAFGYVSGRNLAFGGRTVHAEFRASLRRDCSRAGLQTVEQASLSSPYLLPGAFYTVCRVHD